MANPRADSATTKNGRCKQREELLPINMSEHVYKIFTGMIGSYMKNYADRNNIWDKGQLGTCSGVLGTADQLVIDNAIIDEVRGERKAKEFSGGILRLSEGIRHSAT